MGTVSSMLSYRKKICLSSLGDVSTASLLNHIVSSNQISLKMSPKPDKNSPQQGILTDIRLKAAVA